MKNYYLRRTKGRMKKDQNVVVRVNSTTCSVDFDNRALAARRQTVKPTKKQCSTKETAMPQLGSSKGRKANKSDSKVKKKWTDLGTRCAPGYLLGLVNQFEPHIKNSINDIGFGWAFHLKCTNIKRKLCKFLVNNFDGVSCSLNLGGSHVRLYPSDVHHVIGLPCSGADISVEGTVAEHNALYEKYYGTTTSLTVSQLHSELTSCKEVNEGFIVKFVMFVLGTFLCPTTSVKPKRELIGCFKDVKNIGSLNWAKFVLGYLVASIRKYNRNKQVGIGGCLLFLQLYYYERYCTEFENPAFCIRTVPRIRDWNDEKVRARQKLHKKAGGYEQVQLVKDYDEDTNDGKRLPNALDSNGPQDTVIESITEVRGQMARLYATINDLPKLFETQSAGMMEGMNKNLTVYIKAEVLKDLANGYTVKTDPQPHDSHELRSPDLPNPDQQTKDELAITRTPDGTGAYSDMGNALHTEMSTEQALQNERQFSTVCSENAVENLTTKKIKKLTNLTKAYDTACYKVGMQTRSAKHRSPVGVDISPTVRPAKKRNVHFESGEGAISDVERSVQMETTNSIWPPSPSLLLPGPIPERLKDLSIKDWSQISGAVPVPCRQAPSLFNTSIPRSELHTRTPYEVDLSTSIDRLSARERLSVSSLDKKKIKESSDRLMNGILKLGILEIRENGNSGMNCKEQLGSCANVTRQLTSVKEDPSTPHFGWSVPNASVNENNGQTGVSGTHSLPPPPPLLPKPFRGNNGVDSSSEVQKRNGRLQGDDRGKNQLLSRYWPRITDQELQQLSGDPNSVITPLFETMLSASDAGRIGRLVLPKKCAEAYFPPISMPEGLPLKVQDVKGKEWVFQFRLWPNNNSRMYVLEGVTPCIQSMQLQAGDIVTFSRLEPEGKLVMGFRKASTAPSSDQDIEMSKTGNGVPTHGDAELVDPAITWSKVDKSGSIAKDVPVSKSPVPRKRKNSTLGSKSKRLRIDNMDLMELKITREEAQGLLRPPANHIPSVVIIEGFEFEEYEDAPVIGKPTIFTTDNLGEKIQWAQCEDCSKWRKLPADSLLS